MLPDCSTPLTQHGTHACSPAKHLCELCFERLTGSASRFGAFGVECVANGIQILPAFEWINNFDGDMRMVRPQSATMSGPTRRRTGFRPARCDSRDLNPRNREPTRKSNPRPRQQKWEVPIGASHHETGAGTRDRTPDPLITNQVLCQLSYTGARWDLPTGETARNPLQQTTPKVELGSAEDLRSWQSGKSRE